MNPLSSLQPPEHSALEYLLGLPRHPFADAFPRSERQIADLAEDIGKNGQLVPIRIRNGRITDGITRLLACKKLGIEPIFEEIPDGDDIETILSLNLKRRSQTSGQKAAMAALLIDTLKSDRKSDPQKFAELRGSGELREIAAKLLGTNPDYVSRAQRIRESSSSTFEQVLSGSLNISTAYRDLFSNKEDLPRSLIDTKLNLTVCEPIRFLSDLPDESVDLLLTGCEHSVLRENPDEWLPIALRKLRATGRAFIVLRAEPELVRKYLETARMQTDSLKFFVRNFLSINLDEKWNAREEYRRDYIALHLAAKTTAKLNFAKSSQKTSYLKFSRSSGKFPLESLGKTLTQHGSSPNQLVVDPFADKYALLLRGAASVNRQVRGCFRGDK